MKKIIIVVIIVVAVLFALGMVKDEIIKASVTVAGSSMVGAPLHIDMLSLGLLRQTIYIKGLKLYNPPKFPKDVFLDVPEVNIDYDLWALLKGKLHLRMAAVNLNKVVVIRNEEGKLNVDSLKIIQEQKKLMDEYKKKGMNPPPMMPIKIDMLALSIGEVVFKDNSSKDNPSVQQFDIGMKEKIFTHINGVGQLVTLLLMEALKPTALKTASLLNSTTIMGVTFSPAEVAANLLGDDGARVDLDMDFEKVYRVSLAVIKKSGELVIEDKGAGLIKAKVEGCDVTAKIVKKTPETVTLEVSARKLLLPKQQVANHLIYQIWGGLK